MRNDACWGVVHWWLVLRISDLVLVFKISGDVWLFLGWEWFYCLIVFERVPSQSLPSVSKLYGIVLGCFRNIPGTSAPHDMFENVEAATILSWSISWVCFRNSRLGQQCRCRWATAGHVSRWILSFLSHGVYPIYHPFIDGCSILNQPFWSILGIPSFEESPPYGSIWRQGTLHCNNVTVVIVPYCNLKGLMCFRQGSQWESPWCLSCVTGATGVALLVVASRRKPSWVCLKIRFIIRPVPWPGKSTRQSTSQYSGHGRFIKILDPTEFVLSEANTEWLPTLPFRFESHDGTMMYNVYR